MPAALVPWGGQLVPTKWFEENSIMTCIVVVYSWGVGTPKSTIIKEIMCDYYDDWYNILLCCIIHKNRYKTTTLAILKNGPNTNYSILVEGSKFS